jgi:hypothetical protein
MRGWRRHPLADEIAFDLPDKGRYFLVGETCRQGVIGNECGRPACN